MSFRLMPVISRMIYMLTLRAAATLATRDVPRIMSGVVLYVRATSEMILSTVTGTGCSSFRMSLMAFCAAPIVGRMFSSRR